VPQELSEASGGVLSTVFGDTKTFGNYDQLDTEVGEKLDHIPAVPWTGCTAAWCPVVAAAIR